MLKLLLQRISFPLKMIKNGKNIVLFDGVCNLCNRLIRFIIKRDPKAIFRFAALQSKTGQELLMQMKLPMNDMDSVVYISEEEYFFRSSAILHILHDLGGVWKLFYAFIVIPSFCRDFIYSIVAKTRYKVFGKRETCMVPTPDLQQRFLD